MKIKNLQQADFSIEEIKALLPGNDDLLAAAFEQNITGTVPTQLPEIEPNPDDAAAAETVAAVIIIILVVCVVIYICDSSN